MKRIALASLCIALGSTVMVPALSHAEVSCTRPGLQQAVDLYIAAQSKGDPSALPLAKGVGYWENAAPAELQKGFINRPMKIDHQRSFLDTDTCQSVTESIVTDKAAPFVFSTRLRVNHDKIVEVEILWTTTGYWLFDADKYLQHSSEENWEAIAAEKRTPRGVLVAAANAYLDAFLEKRIDLVPWGFPCERTEGGRGYTGKGSPADSCEVGVPAGVNIANRHFVVDEVLGVVSVYCTFGAGGPNGGSGAPDNHTFRIENGKLRYVHTLTHLLQPKEGLTPPRPASKP
ncbi:MAG TPA: hypothetical protein VK700_00510 [Steroidobacteraceae bacterium]|jgi:hypothetical protein|nr:hypothetical protein [Steroidobacteraceae bacterium]